LIGNVELLGSVQVIGGNEMPGRETFTPELIIFPPMIVGPMLTEMGPTLGGTNVSNPDPGACAMEGGLVAALAPLTGERRAIGSSFAALRHGRVLRGTRWGCGRRQP
jgi:hypothetical protein